MPERFLGQDFVSILAADAVPDNEAFFLEVLDDSLDGPFGDPDANGDFPKH